MSLCEDNQLATDFAFLAFQPYLEKRLRIRPEGVVSKNLIGERKIAKAILS
jgi:hypothetical protein